MKKVFYIIACAAAIVISAASCTKKEESSRPDVLVSVQATIRGDICKLANISYNVTEFDGTSKVGILNENFNEEVNFGLDFGSAKVGDCATVRFFSALNLAPSQEALDSKEPYEISVCTTATCGTASEKWYGGDKDSSGLIALGEVLPTLNMVYVEAAACVNKAYGTRWYVLITVTEDGFTFETLEPTDL